MVAEMHRRPKILCW